MMRERKHSAVSVQDGMGEVCVRERKERETEENKVLRSPGV